jgi:hypothetical protein
MWRRWAAPARSTTRLGALCQDFPETVACEGVDFRAMRGSAVGGGLNTGMNMTPGIQKERSLHTSGIFFIDIPERTTSSDRDGRHSLPIDSCFGGIAPEAPSSEFCAPLPYPSHTVRIGIRSCACEPPAVWHFLLLTRGG